MSRRQRGGREVRHLGEFALIERLASRLPSPRPDVVVGIGDDVAVLELAADRLLLVTCDAQVAGTHFLPDRCDPHRLGRKAAAINLSDIAAVGGRPTHFLSSLVLPPAIEVAFLEALYDGLAEEAARFGADVVGGNVSRGESLVIDLTLLGEAAPAHLLRRSGARPGDRVLVTGHLGAAAAGLHVLVHPGVDASEETRRRARDAFELPVPRLAEVRAIVEAGGATAAIDVSDGLAADLGRVCDSSRVGVRVDAATVPVADCAREVAGTAGLDALAWALGGGEDYEIVFTAPSDRVESLIEAVKSSTGTPVAVIGAILPHEAGRILVLRDGREQPLPTEGFRHF